jgi:hypothetical protein
MCGAARCGVVLGLRLHVEEQPGKSGEEVCHPRPPQRDVDKLSLIGAQNLFLYAFWHMAFFSGLSTPVVS